MYAAYLLAPVYPSQPQQPALTNHTSEFSGGHLIKKLRQDFDVEIEGRRRNGNSVIKDDHGQTWVLFVIQFKTTAMAAEETEKRELLLLARIEEVVGNRYMRLVKPASAAPQVDGDLQAGQDGLDKLLRDIEENAQDTEPSENAQEAQPIQETQESTSLNQCSSRCVHACHASMVAALGAPL